MFSIGFGSGIVSTTTSNVTVDAPPLAASVPTAMPVAGSSAVDAPLTVTLPDTKVVPVGITSVNTTFVASMAPVFLATTV